MTWAQQCIASGSGLSVWNGIGTQDRYTTSATAMKKWRTYSKDVLGCDASDEEETVHGGDVTCLTYPSCPGAKKSSLCLYDGMTHHVQDMDVVYGMGAVATAWSFLASTTSSECASKG